MWEDYLFSGSQTAIFCDVRFICYEFYNVFWYCFVNMTNNHISYIVCVSHPYVISSGFLEYQKRMLHSNTGCIYETALHCSFSCVSSKLLAEKMHTDTVYICVASRSCASSCAFLVLSLENAFPQLKHFNNLLLVCEFKCDWEDGFQRMYIYTDYNWMACLQCASLNVFNVFMFQCFHVSTQAR